MANFEVEFDDGAKLVKEADTADLAKAQARADRRAKVPEDTPRSAPEVKIRRVTRLEEKKSDRSPATRGKE